MNVLCCDGIIDHVAVTALLIAAPSHIPSDIIAYVTVASIAAGAARAASAAIGAAVFEYASFTTVFVVGIDGWGLRHYI